VLPALSANYGEGLVLMAMLKEKIGVLFLLSTKFQNRYPSQDDYCVTLNAVHTLFLLFTVISVQSSHHYIHWLLGNVASTIAFATVSGNFLDQTNDAVSKGPQQYTPRKIVLLKFLSHRTRWHVVQDVTMFLLVGFL
jgi:hypothetical protein